MEKNMEKNFEIQREQLQTLLTYLIRRGMSINLRPREKDLVYANKVHNTILEVIAGTADNIVGMPPLEAAIYRINMIAPAPLEGIQGDYRDFVRNKIEELIELNKENEERKSLINHPSHYQGSIECIDAIHEALDDNEMLGFCKANAMKYLWRAGKKEGNSVQQDLEKAKWYIEYALKLWQ